MAQQLTIEELLAVNQRNERLLEEKDLIIATLKYNEQQLQSTIKCAETNLYQLHHDNKCYKTSLRDYERSVAIYEQDILKKEDKIRELKEKAVKLRKNKYKREQKIQYDKDSKEKLIELKAEYTILKRQNKNLLTRVGKLLQVLKLEQDPLVDPNQSGDKNKRCSSRLQMNSLQQLESFCSDFNLLVPEKFVRLRSLMSQSNITQNVESLGSELDSDFIVESYQPTEFKSHTILIKTEQPDEILDHGLKIVSFATVDNLQDNSFDNVNVKDELNYDSLE